jgi:hypothetical protein
MIAVWRALKLQLLDVPVLGLGLVSVACNIVPVNMRVSLGERVADPRAVDKSCIKQRASVYCLGFLPPNELRAEEHIGDEHDNNGSHNLPEEAFGEREKHRVERLAISAARRATVTQDSGNRDGMAQLPLQDDEQLCCRVGAAIRECVNHNVGFRPGSLSVAAVIKYSKHHFCRRSDGYPLPYVRAGNVPHARLEQYFAMWFLPAPSHVQRMTSSFGATSCGLKSDMRGPSVVKTGSAAAMVVMFAEPERRWRQRSR